MALYFTFYLECYREEDAARIAERLKSWENWVNERPVTMARVEIEPQNGFWYDTQTPKAPVILLPIVE